MLVTHRDLHPHLAAFLSMFSTEMTSAQSVQTCWSSCQRNTGESEWAHRECERDRSPGEGDQ